MRTKGSDIAVLLYQIGEAPRPKFIPNTLEAMQELVGGYIETVTLEDGLTVACYVRMYQYLIQAQAEDLIDMDEFRLLLHRQVTEVITGDTSRWTSEYVCKPSLFIETREDEVYAENKDIADYEYDEILEIKSSTRSLFRSTIRVTRPTSFVRVTNVAGSTEYYHPDAGLVTGDFYDDNNGDWIEAQIENFIDDVYGSTNNMTYMYYLFGEWNSTYQTHQGTDMRNTASNPRLYSAHEGEVVTVGATGRIGIYDGDVTYFYAHCENRQVVIGENVEIGDYIATEGKVGASVAHLHFEVRNGRKTSMGSQNTSLNSLRPYDYM